MSIMKKLSAALLCIAIVACFAGCGGKTDVTETTSSAESTANSNNSSSNTAKTGYAVFSSFSDVEDTELSIDSVCAGVLVDEEERIIDIMLDETQTKPDLDKDNGTVSDLKTKREKKDNYGMKPASDIGKEWYEQVQAFEKWAVGKTADEIKAGVDDEGYASDTDLKAGCTINVSSFIKATVKAVDNARELGASQKDKIRLKITVSKSDESSDVNLQYDTDFAVVTLDDDGRITSCLVDSCQAKCTLKNGEFTVDEGDIPTKKELGDDYGMKPASDIGKEWYEQAENFEKWAVGKTADEIKDGVDDKGYASDADLKAGCTMKISALASTVAAAAAED